MYDNAADIATDPAAVHLPAGPDTDADPDVVLAEGPDIVLASVPGADTDVVAAADTDADTDVVPAADPADRVRRSTKTKKSMHVLVIPCKK